MPEKQSSAQAPEITTFQLDRSNVGAVGSSVNLFRGSVTLPLQLLSMSGRNGLELQLEAVYAGDAARQSSLSNALAPTGILGLGWSLPFDQVRASERPGSIRIEDRSFTATADGNGGQLVLVDTFELGGKKVHSFELESYRFWRIHYFPDAERWEITLPNGLLYVYGDKTVDRGGVQWGFAWNGWTGSSSALPASTYATAWNLIEVRHGWGDAMTYSYENDTVQLAGKGSPSYTRASYLAGIVDVYGRRVLFDYASKVNRRRGPREYVPPHLSNGTDPAAYQDRYETRYLEAIRVESGKASPLFSIHFGYELVNTSPEVPGSNPGRGTLVKRYLTSISKIMASGESRPGMRFTYDWQAPDAGHQPHNSGALLSVTYPSGATASYRYGLQTLGNASLTQAVESAEGTPRVWYGSDFAVITWQSSSQLTLQVWSWGGTWFDWQLPSPITLPIAEDTLRVLTGDDWFALTFTDATHAPADHVYLFRRHPSQVGSWISAPAHSLPRDASDLPTVAVAGRRFVALCNREYSADGVVVFGLGTGGWQTQDLGNEGAEHLTITGGSSYLVACNYASGQGAFDLWGFDPISGEMTRGDSWTDSFTVDFELLRQAGEWESTFFSPGSTFVATTYPLQLEVSKNQEQAARDASATGDASATWQVQIRVYSWNAELEVSNTQGSFTQVLETPFDLELPTLVTVASSDQIGNCNFSARFDGERWLAETVDLPQTTAGQLGFGYGSDLLVMTDGAEAPSVRRFDPVTDTWGHLDVHAPEGSAPLATQIAGDLMSIGTSVYLRGQSSDWQRLGNLPADVSTSSVRNGGDFVVFQSGQDSHASTAFAFPIEGRLVLPAQAEQFSNQSFVTGDDGAPGTELVGPGMLVTFPSGSSFDETTQLTLHRVLGPGLSQKLEHAAVLATEVDDGHRRLETHYAYDTSSATYDGDGRVAQYARAWQWRGGGASPPEAPYGFVEYRYFNGLPPGIHGTFYPNADSARYYSLLPGTLLFQRSYAAGDAAPCPTTQLMNLPVVHTKTATKELTGAWVRSGTRLASMDLAFAFELAADRSLVAQLDEGELPQSVLSAFEQQGYPLAADSQVLTELAGARWMVIDRRHDALYLFELRSGGELAVTAGVTQITHKTYNLGNGALATATTTVDDVDGEAHRRTRRVSYAVDATRSGGKPAYPGLRLQHQLTAVDRTTLEVDGTATSIDLVTWQGQWGESEHWAPAGLYKARTATAQYDYGGEPAPAQWQLVRRVESRDSRGQVTQSAGAEGSARSLLYSAGGSLPIATFSNARQSDGEVLYCGFESYEDLSGWQLDGAPLLASATASAAPGPLSVGDAHTGHRGLRLLPGQGPGQGLSSSWTLTPQSRRYLFTCKARTGTGYTTGAAWTLSADAAASAETDSTTPTSLELPIPATGGAWESVHGVLELSAGELGSPLTVRLVALNQDATADVLLDDVLFLPLPGRASVQVYDPESWATLATTGSNGVTGHIAVDGFHRGAVASRDRRRPAIAGVAGSSRAAHADAYDPGAPNLALQLTSGDGGVLEDFLDGDAWATRWQASSGTGEDWQAADGQLVHRGETASQLELIGAAERSGWVWLARIVPRGWWTDPVGMAVNTAAAVRWMPGADASSAGSWNLVDPASGEPLADAVTPGPLFTLPGRLAAGLEEGKLSPELAEALLSRGVPLPDSGRGCTLSTVTAGSAWRLDEPAGHQRYRLELSSADDPETATLTVSRLTLAPATWALVLSGSRLIFLAGGTPIFSWQAPDDLLGAPILEAAAPLSLGFLSVQFGAQPTLGWLDGAGQFLQSQSLDSAAVYGSAVLYDEIGRRHCVTKAMELEAPGYRGDLAVGLDPETGELIGEVSAYYRGQDGRSDDGGYPYLSLRFENSPTSRPLERGVPGADFAIRPGGEGHTTLYGYQTAGTTLDLTPGTVRIAQITDPNGVPGQVVVDKLGRQLAQLQAQDAAASSWRTSTFAQSYHEHGSVITQALPNAFDPPAGSTAADWQISHTLDMQGRVLSRTSTDQGTCRTLFDGLGHPVFHQTAEGAAASPPWVVYSTYDALGRRTETGTVSLPEQLAWRRGQLERQLADASPEQRRWYQRWHYDDVSAGLGGLGRLARAEIAGGDGRANVVETRRYDASARLQVAGEWVAGDAGVQRTRYAMDDLGRVRRVDYPDGETRVTYSYDQRGLLRGVGDGPSNPTAYAAYTYDANGQPQSESLQPGSAGAVERSFSLNSPGWLVSLSDGLQQESFGYTEGAAGGGGRFDGTIGRFDGTIGRFDGTLASYTQTFSFEGAPAEIDVAFGYQQAGWLTEAEQAADAITGAEPAATQCQPASRPASQPACRPESRRDSQQPADASWSYDANGNLLSMAGQTLHYIPGTDKLRRLGEGPAQDIVYNRDGAVIHDPAAGIRRIEWHAVSRLATSIETAAGAVLELTYGSCGQRVLEVESGATPSTRRRYLCGAEIRPLVDRRGDEHTALIYGLRGLVAFRRRGKTFSTLLDRLGSVSVVADEAGRPVAAYSYGPWGQLVSTWGDAAILDRLFTGGQLDRSTGLYNFHLRLFDPRTGRFLSPDPLSQFPSPYLYGANNPLSFIDPYGASSFWAWLLGGLAVVLTVAVSAVAIVLSLGTDAPEVLAADAAVIDGVGDLEAAVDGIAEGLDAAAGALDGVDGLSAAGDGFETASEGFESASDGFETASDFSDSDFFSCEGDSFPDDGGGYGEFFKDLGRAIMEFGDQLWDPDYGEDDELLLGQDASRRSYGTLPEAGESGGEAGEGWGPWFRRKLWNGGEAVTGGLMSGGQAIVGAVQGTYRATRNMVIALSVLAFSFTALVATVFVYKIFED